MVVEEREKVGFVEDISDSQIEVNERNNFIVECLLDGESLTDIGYAVGLTKERIRQFAVYWDLHDEWKEKNREVKQARSPVTKRIALQDLVNELTDKLMERTKREGWAYEQAARYFLITTSDHKFGDYLRLFKAYDNARTREKKLSLQQLEDISGFEFRHINYMFRKLGIEPMHGRTQIRKLKKSEKDTVKRSFKIPMSAEDIAYFVGISYHAVQGHFWRMGGNEKRPEHDLRIENFGQGNVLTYRLASQIYEAEDLGFKSAEIAQLIDRRQELVDSALKRREIISAQIINALRMMYQRDEITKPYLTTKQRQHYLFHFRS